MRVCSEPGCPEVQPESTCLAHRRVRETKRGSTTARGYGYAHRKLRDAWAIKVASGTVNCARCGERIGTFDEWDLDHTDDRTGYLGPSHPACNRAAEAASQQPSALTLVVGAPCSGKTTYVDEHRQPGDVVLDYDRLAQALGSDVSHGHAPCYIAPIAEATEAILRTVALRGGQVWWIKCWPTQTDLARATDVRWMHVSLRTCHDRATAERRPSSWYQLIEDWYEMHGHRISPDA